MKIKKGFVTNSSSTSFCCWGIETESKNIPEEILKKGYDLYLNRKEDKRFRWSMVRDDENDIPYDEFKEEVLEYGSQLYTEYITSQFDDLKLDSIFSYDRFYIGRSPFTMRENETLGSFLEILKIDLREAGFENFDISGICEYVSY